MSIRSILLLVAVTVFEVLGDTALALWAKRTYGAWSVWTGAFGYFLAGVLIAVLMRLEGGKLARAASLVTIANMVGAVVIGALIFKEHFSKREWSGVALGIIAIILIGSSESE